MSAARSELACENLMIFFANDLRSADFTALEHVYAAITTLGCFGYSSEVYFVLTTDILFKSILHYTF